MNIKKIRKRYTKQNADYLIQIGKLLEQGYPLYQAITFIQLHVSPEIKKQFKLVLEQLKAGYPVHESFQFLEIPRTYRSFLYFYEQQGDLANGFIQAGQLLKKQEKMKQECMKLLRYPLFLLWFCFFILTLMYYFVAPHFQSFFTLLNDVPTLTKVVFQLIEYTPHIFVVCLIITIIAILLYMYQLRSKTTEQKVEKIINIPYIGKHLKVAITYYFSLQLGRLLEVGLSLQESLKMFTNQDYVVFFQQECLRMIHELHQGYSLSDSVTKRKYFQKELSFVIENGEKTGYIEKDLVQYSELLYEQLDESLQKLLRTIQPFFFVFIGSIVFILFLATMMPMFQMISAL